MEIKKPSNEQYIEGEVKLSERANALYRLNGDKNLIHIDQAVAERAGFHRPILHGLCTFGITARLIAEIKQPVEIKRIGARFTSHVFPGETLKIKIWDSEEDRVYFETSIKERGTTAMKGFINYTS